MKKRLKDTNYAFYWTVHWIEIEGYCESKENGLARIIGYLRSTSLDVSLSLDKIIRFCLF